MRAASRAPLHELPLGALLDAVAARTPAPGGGAVAAAVGSLSAALAQMVVSFSLGRASLAAHQEELARAAAKLERARALLLGLAEEDAAAFEPVAQLLRLGPGDPQRARDLPGAVLTAMAPPRAAAAASADLLRLMETLVGITNRNLRSDLAIAAVLAEATARAAWWNIAANLALHPAPASLGDLTTEMRVLLDEAARRRAEIETRCAW
ncbi:MAG TPA: cyclodeaminase/cyclohydrolase family protein [Phycisphaerales bacterium]|nr:cyclodeaminase/cyclohydrolase family protein [Phycisphaerales bacterium]